MARHGSGTPWPARAAHPDRHVGGSGRLRSVQTGAGSPARGRRYPVRVWDPEPGEDDAPPPLSGHGDNVYALAAGRHQAASWLARGQRRPNGVSAVGAGHRPPPAYPAGPSPEVLVACRRSDGTLLARAGPTGRYASGTPDRAGTGGPGATTHSLRLAVLLPNLRYKLEGISTASFATFPASATSNPANWNRTFRRPTDSAPDVPLTP